MNHKQKLGYTALGALIMLVGIGAGSIVSPPLIAQRAGVFGEIQCTGLTVVDKHGKLAIYLESREEGNRITLINKAGSPAVSLAAHRAHDKYPAFHGVVVYNQAGKNGVTLSSDDLGNTVQIWQRDNVGIILNTYALTGNSVNVYDQKSNIVLTLQAGGVLPNGVFVRDKAGNTVRELRAD